MRLSDIAKLAQGATGANPIGIAAEAVVLLGRIADAVEQIAAQGVPPEVCSSCEEAGRWMCPEHGERSLKARIEERNSRG